MEIRSRKRVRKPRHRTTQMTVASKLKIIKINEQLIERFSSV